MNLYQPTISGSLTVSGSVEIIGPFTMSGGSISGTSSFAANAGLLQGLDSTSFVGTGSFNTMSSSVSTRVTTIESKYATTGSNIFTGAQTVCANITSTGTIIAQTLNVQQVTSSVVYSSGSNVFGNLSTDVQQMTGSLRVSGSNALFNVGCVGIGNVSPAANLHVLTPSTGTGVIFRYTGGTNNPGLFVSTEESTKYVRLTASGTSVAGQLLQLGAEGTAGVVNVGVANVGIGTPTNLNQRLTIVDSNDAEALGVYRCFSAASDAGTYFRLGALNGSGVPTAGAAIFGALESAKTSGYLSFFTYCGSTACERMRITSAGTVGIGTTSPGSMLESKAPGTGATTNYASKNIIANSPLIGGYTGAPIVSMLAMYDGSIHGADIGYLYDSIGYGLAFSVNNDTSGDPIERMRITKTGNVGIGTCSPSGQLHLKGASGLTNFGDQMLQVESSTSNYSGIVFSGTNGSNAAIRSEGASTMTFWTATGTTYTERMRITCGGLVGIGTCTPDVLLTVDGQTGGASTVNIARIYASKGQTDAAYLQIQGTRHPTASVRRIVLEALDGGGSSASLILQQNGGNVGVGTTNPVDCIIGSGTILEVAGTGGGSLKLRYTNATNYGEFSLYKGTNGSYIDSAGATTAANNDLIFRTAGAASYSVAERMRVGSDGSITFRGGTTAVNAVFLSNDCSFFRLYAGDSTASTKGFIFYVTNGTTQPEAIRISSTGDLTVNGNIYTSTGANRFIRLGSASAYYYDLQSVGDNFEIKEAGTTTRMKIFYPSGITCFSSTICAPCFATISDYRMKSNLRPIEGLSIIMNTKPYKFDYNYDCAPSFGMIAHELQEVVPEAVFGVKDGEVMQGVDYMKLLPISIKAIQEQQCIINQLRCENYIFKTCLGIA